jgi:cytochrome c oxidase subunit II
VTVASLLPGALDPPVTDQADELERAWTIYLYIGYVVLALVVVLVLYVMIRFRRRDDTLPAQKHYNIPVEVAYTVLPLVLVMALFGITLVTLQNVEATPDDPDLTVHVTAFQWQWQFDYPESGVTVAGGAGDDVPELILPADSTVSFELESLDVIHSFWITIFRFKRDMIPGRPSEFSVDIDDAPGFYPNAGVCAEFCGLDHALMRFSVRILEPEEFDRWLADRSVGSGTGEA